MNKFHKKPEISKAKKGMEVFICIEHGFVVAPSFFFFFIFYFDALRGAAATIKKKTHSDETLRTMQGCVRAR